MNTDTISAAKRIVPQLQAVVTSMFDESERGLRENLSALRSSLSRVQSYVESLGRPGSGPVAPGRQAATVAGSEAPAKPGRRRRGSKRFKTSAFVLKLLAQNPKGMRPKDIATALRKEAPAGQHKNPLSTVNTTLANMKKARKVINKGGIWAAGRG